MMANNFIDKLTAEQQALLPAWKEEWLKIGTASGPSDRAKCGPAIARAYQILGREPQPIQWVVSPLAAQREIKRQKPGLVGGEPPWFWGQLDAYWVSYYLFCQHVGHKFSEPDEAKLSVMVDLCHGGWVYLFEHGAFVCDRPVIHTSINAQGHYQLHYEYGPALAYEDELKIWSLNGVTVPQWLVETKAADLDPVKVTTIENADVRREFVHKVGPERIVQALSPNGPIDQQVYSTKDGREHRYQLYRFEVWGRPWTYLRMQNPSVDLTHFEGVPNICNTVDDALRFRWQLKPENLRPDGEDWHVQGDVILKPKGARFLKPFPAVLTAGLLAVVESLLK